jgi:hypothetical protein
MRRAPMVLQLTLLVACGCSLVGSSGCVPGFTPWTCIP